MLNPVRQPEPELQEALFKAALLCVVGFLFKRKIVCPYYCRVGICVGVWDYGNALEGILKNNTKVR